MHHVANHHHPPMHRLRIRGLCILITNLRNTISIDASTLVQLFDGFFVNFVLCIGSPSPYRLSSTSPPHCRRTAAKLAPYRCEHHLLLYLPFALLLTKSNPQNASQVQKIVALLVPGLTPDLLSLPPPPATANPNLPISIPARAIIISLIVRSSVAAESGGEDPVHRDDLQPCMSNTGTRRPNADAQCAQHFQCVFLFSVFFFPFFFPFFWSISITHTNTLLAETNKTDPTQYVLTPEQMIGNDYPMPSYMADVFEKPAGWVEMPQPKENETKWNQKIYGIDCEMVRDTTSFSPTRFFGCVVWSSN
jgi:hypothetical protein